MGFIMTAGPVSKDAELPTRAVKSQESLFWAKADVDCGDVGEIGEVIG